MNEPTMQSQLETDLPESEQVDYQRYVDEEPVLVKKTKKPNTKYRSDFTELRNDMENTRD